MGPATFNEINRSRPMRPAVVSQDPPGHSAVAGGPSAAPSLASEPSPAVGAPSRTWLDFTSYLARKYSITGDLISPTAATNRGRGRRLRDLWDLTDLSADDFADEVARFYDLPRARLPQ